MSLRDVSVIVLLVLFAAFIWLRDPAWMAAPDEALPVLVSIPLLFWLGRPWRLQSNRRRPPTGWGAVAVVLAAAGIGLDLTVLLALGWASLLWSALAARLPAEDLRRKVRLLPLAVLAFPWIMLDAEVLGWWFRLSGAWATSGLFALVGFDVVREGTRLLVQGLPVSVEAACSGLGALQAMLIAGTLVAYFQIGDREHYWWHLPMLVVVAWLANTLRIVVICMVALSVGPQLAYGSFHFFGGWVVLCVVFCLCWILFSVARRYETSTLHPAP